ncbi:uncharacterized protein [Diadema antillarum]|uniref:uncharacterized protein n=1 Tax=Diadema antillarum TaxID=105358 RepID=UPI003A852DAB
MDNGLNSTISCPVCFEDYDTPKALPCLHTFCLKCLQRWSAEGSITCPFCNLVHDLPPDGVAGFPTNYALSKVVTDLKSPKFHEVMSQKFKFEEVEDIVRREVNNLKHLVDVVHVPLLQSIARLKKGASVQEKDKVLLVEDLYNSVIAHAEKEKEKHIKRIQMNTADSVRYFDDAQTSILKEKGKIESFCRKAERRTYEERDKMDLNSFLTDSAEYNRSGRRMATDHSLLMWSHVDVIEGKEQVRLIHSSLGGVIRAQTTKRSHRPRIGTMEVGKGRREAANKRERSKSEPNPDAINTACLPRVDRGKLSDPVRNVVDIVLQRFRNNKSQAERLHDTSPPQQSTKRRPQFSPTTSVKRNTVNGPPPYRSHPDMRRYTSDEEPLVIRTAQSNHSPPHRSESSKSNISGNSNSSGTSSIPGPPKPPRSPSTPAFRSPCGIAISNDGQLLIAERNPGLIRLTYPRSLRMKRQINPFMGHADEAKAHALFDLTILPTGDIAVTDSNVKKVIFLQKANNYAAPQQIWMPHDMVPRGITSDGSCIYIGDAGNGCIQVYTHTGKHCSSIELDNLTQGVSTAVSKVCPQSVAVSPGGHILVSDIINRCLYLVLRTGEISGHPMRFRQLNGIRCSSSPAQAVPRGVCWLDDRCAFIVEEISQEILLVNVRSMELIRVIRRREFSSIQGLIVDKAGDVIVTDIEKNRVHVVSRSEYISNGRGMGLMKRSKSLSGEERLSTLV